MFDTVHFPNYVAILMLLNDLSEYKLQDSNMQEKNHNIKTYDTQNSVWLHNFVSCDIFCWLLLQIFFVWAEVLWPVHACMHRHACLYEVSDYHQLWLLLPAAIFLPCCWWQSVLWVSVSLMWRIKRHFDKSQNGTCFRNFSFAVTHTN